MNKFLMGLNMLRRGCGILAKPGESALSFWNDRYRVCTTSSAIAKDLVTAPASKVYVERIFSQCGLFTIGRRNRMAISLEKRVFLKLNTALWSRAGVLYFVNIET